MTSCTQRATTTGAAGGGAGGARGVAASSAIPRQSMRRARAPATILFVGDVVGSLGKHTLLGLLPALRERHAPTFVVVNGENAAGGLGITPKIADELFARRRRRHHARQPRLPPARDLRLPRRARGDPAAVQLPAQPARPRRVRRRARRRAARRGEPHRQPLRARGLSGVHVDRAGARRAGGRVDHVLVDFHAEATSEKVALGWHLDGRVTASSGPTRTSRPPTRACCPAAPRTSPTSA